MSQMWKNVGLQRTTVNTLSIARTMVGALGDKHAEEVEKDLNKFNQNELMVMAKMLLSTKVRHLFTTEDLAIVLRLMKPTGDVVGRWRSAPLHEKYAVQLMITAATKEYNAEELVDTPEPRE